MERDARRIQQVLERLGQQADLSGRMVQMVRSPLRVCPLGAHVDHQLGKVTGFTLNEAVLLAFVPRYDGVVRVTSLDFPGEVTFELADIQRQEPGEWGNYARGAAWVMRERSQITTGIDAVVSGPLPIGGLSSSAAVDVAYLLALQTVNNLEVPAKENIRLAQRIENDFVGLNNGILDQSIILTGRRRALTVLDCSNVQVSYVPTPREMRFDVVIAHSGLSRSLVSSDFNRRVSECQAAAGALLTAAGQEVPEGVRFRAVTREVYEQHVDALPAMLARRARHYFGELARVDAGVDAWNRGDIQTVGRLMVESGRSSIENYECGCPHTISLYEILNRTPGVYGSRFSGAGFRGAVVALADPDAREQVAAAVATDYVRRHPEIADQYSVHFCAPGVAAEVTSCRV